MFFETKKQNKTKTMTNRWKSKLPSNWKRRRKRNGFGARNDSLFQTPVAPHYYHFYNYNKLN